jgi:hypothetical protein
MLLTIQVDQSEQEALLGLTAPYQPSQEAQRQPKGDIEGRDIESTVTKQGREYARQIARNASKKQDCSHRPGALRYEKSKADHLALTMLFIIRQMAGSMVKQQKI